MTADHRTPSGVQSVERVLDLLELMAQSSGEQSPGEQGLSQLAAESGLPLATIHRLVRTLVVRGYVRQLPSRRYGLGPRLIWLGDRAGRALSGWARPLLAELVEALGETANMAMLDGDMVVYVAQAPSNHSMRMFTEVGRRVHLHCTGVGKAVLAQLDQDTVRAIAARTGLPAQTPATITDVEPLLAELATVRAQGYAVDASEQEVGVRCYAVPVPGAPALSAISVSGPDTRLDTSRAGQVTAELRRVAAALGSEFQHPGW